MMARNRQQEEEGDDWSLGLSVDWERRLLVDPAGALRDLRRLCGHTRPATDDLESTYWKALLASASDDELAVAVLLRVRTEADFRQSLLQIGGKQVMLLHQHFKALAVSRIGETDLDPSIWDQAIDNAYCLGSNALQDLGKQNEAAAFYVLAHDLLTAEQPITYLERLYLRFGLCHSLFPPEEPIGAGVQDYLKLAKRILEDLFAEPLRELKDSIRKPLRFELYFWMAKVQAEIGELEESAKNFGEAAERAADADDRASSKCRRASVLEKLGRLQEAFVEYCEVEPMIEEITDETLVDLWYVGYWKLKTYLQGGAGPLSETEEVPKLLGRVPAMLGRITRQGLRGGDLAKLPEESIDLFTTILADTSAEEIQTRYRLLISRAENLVQLGRYDEAERDMVEAEALEISFPKSEKPWRSHLFRARLQARQGEPEKAKEKFAAILPQLRASSEKLPEFLGYYLEVLVAAPDSSPERVIDLVGILEGTWTELLGRQPTAGARAQTRMLLQRPVESAMLCLAASADEAGSESPEGQRALARAWALYQEVRNPELRATSNKRTPKTESYQLVEGRQLENAFHGAFRRSYPDLQSGAWALDLERLQQHDAAFITDTKSLKTEAAELPRQHGLWLMLFEISAMLKEPVLLVLAYFQGAYSFKLFPFGVYQRLLDWNQDWLAKARSKGERSRQLIEVTELNSETEDIATQNKAAPEISEILPLAVNLSLSALAISALASRGEEEKMAETAKKFPVYLYPTGQIHNLLFEMIQQDDGGGEYFGRGRAICGCLKAAPVIKEKLNLQRGWLGVGGVPANEPFSALPGTSTEILEIQNQLIQFGVAKEKIITLTGADATVRNLTATLAERSPVVLHLAVHGIAHEDHPEACALVLAPTPGQPAQDLLFFRKIRQLPLEGVDLVVLSACGSLVGRSNHSAGIQGLAWAFLDAGARQVIASRYKVEDTATSKFMAAFYRSLTILPPAEALGMARQECLPEAKGAARQQVGAWSIWS